MNISTPEEKSDDAVRATDKIVEYLARRDHSEQELQQKLGRRFTAEAIQLALEQARLKQWLKPPEELAELVAETLHLRGKGFRYIQNYLLDKGLPPVNQDPEREKQKALELLQSKYGNHKDLSLDERQKVFRFLASRGYDLEIIRSLF